MAKRPSAKWTGVIEFPQLGLAVDGGLYSTQRRGRVPLPVLRVHTACQTRLEAEVPPAQEKPALEEEGEETPKPTEPTPVTAQPHCPSCRRPLRADEIGRAVVTELGLLVLTDGEYAALKPKKEKRVSATLVAGVADMLATIGTGRRFYLLPKADSVVAYYQLFAVLASTGRAGLIQDLLVDRRAYVVVVRPIVTHHSVFGQPQKVLIVDEFADTDALRDPREFQLLPSVEPTVDTASVGALITQAASVTDVVSPDACVNPERRRFTELVERKIAAVRVL